MAIGIAIVSLVFSVMTLLVCLVLLGRRDFPYSQQDDTVVLDRIQELGRKQSQLYRYVEAVDEASGGKAYRVLSAPMPGDQAPAAH